MAPPAAHLLPRQELDALLDALRAEGYAVIGPTVRDGAIVHDRLERASDLPQGLTDVQAPGRYRLERRGDEALFGYAVGPTSWKRFLHPPDIRLWSATRTGPGFVVDGGPPAPERLALLGVRGCELAAIAVQDRVLLEGPVPDPIYRARREAVLIIAVQCGTASDSCFCTSMGTGPGVTSGFDLRLTELLEPTHRFLVEVGSPRGATVVERLELRLPVTEADQGAAVEVVARTADSITRRLDAPAHVPAALRAAYEHPRWDDVAQRCLTCANCTIASARRWSTPPTSPVTTPSAGVAGIRASPSSSATCTEGACGAPPARATGSG